MKKPKQVTFTTLLIQTAISGLIISLIHYFWLQSEPSFGNTGISFLVFCAVNLTIMSLMYKINPFKRRFQSPYKD
ncbi:hypothetical protein [Mongoliibacter ruber]|uniref:hypothetical protein n=1 Tax=Mongoliibacter ruber TaxID=1750599 RepID=UPI0011B238BB|nr:hypothetical protein [Mongoliibacter ruber]